MAEIERLIVELDAKVDGYIKAQEKAQKENDKTGKSALSMGKSIASAGATAVTAIAGVGAALSAMVISTAKGRQELEVLANQTKLSVEEFQSLAFATKQLGINAEQFADQSKDIADKLGEFAAAGTGAFQDFADVTGMTKQQAQELAEEWQHLSSDEVIGEMVKQLEAAGASGNEMTFVLESMGNDLSRLAPLFADNSAKLKEMQQRYDDVNKSIQITEAQAQDLQGAAESFDLLTSTMGNAATAVSATLAPVMDDFFNDIIAVVPDATQAIVDFINTFIDAENIQNITSVENEIEKLQGTMESLMEEQRRFEGLTSSGRESSMQYGIQQQAINDQLKEQKQRYIELGEQLKVLREEEDKRKLANAERGEGGEIGGATGESVKTGGGTGAAVSKELEALEKRLEAYEENSNSVIEILENRYTKEQELIENSKMSEQEKNDALLLLEQEYQEKLAELGQTKEDRMVEELEREVELHAEMLEKKLISEEQFNKLQAESARKYMQGKAKSVSEQDKSEKVLRDKATKDSINALEDLGRENDKFAKASFLLKQGQKLSEAVVNTAAGVTEALPNFPLAAAVGAAGALQIAAIASTTFGGGSSGGSSSIAAAAPETEADFQQETFQQDVTVSEVGDLQTVSKQVVEFKSDGGSPAEQLMIESLNEANRRGSITVRG